MARAATGSVRYVSGRWWARISAHGGRHLVEINPPITDPKAEERAKREAIILTRMAREARPPIARGGEDERVEDWFERWLRAREERGTGCRAAKSHLAIHLLPILRGLEMRRVTPADLERVVRHLDDLVARGELRWKTAINVWGTVTKAFDDAHRGKLAELRCRADNPAKAVRGPDRGVDTEKVHLYPSEFLQLILCAAVPVERRRAYAIGIYLYLRPGELEALRWDDIDLERGQVQIRRNIDRTTGAETSPKAGQARLPHDLEPAIVPLLEVMHRERQRGPVVGRLGDEREVADQLRRDLLTAGVARHELHHGSDDPPREWMRMHDLRTTGVTWMAVRGDDPLVVMARAGHADMQTTLGYVSRAALVRRGYGQTFPPLPLRDLALQSAQNRGKGSKTSGSAWESKGPPGAVERDDARDSRGFLRVVPSGDVTGDAGSRAGADCGADWTAPRKALVHKLLEAAKRAASRGDTGAFWRLVQSATEAAPRPAVACGATGVIATPAPARTARRSTTRA